MTRGELVLQRARHFVPLLGDVEVGFITNPALAEAVRAELVPVATGMTPNLFELALLTGGELDGFLGQDSHAHERRATSAKGLGDTFAAAMVVALVNSQGCDVEDLEAAVCLATGAVLNRIR